MNFFTFRDALFTLQKSIAISNPVSQQILAAHWGSPGKAITDLPVMVNTMAEPTRQLGFGSREQSMLINMQCLCAKATVEDERSANIATAFWFAAKDKFDADTTIDDTVSWAFLRGSDPTVPVIIQYAGIAYIGFSAVLDITHHEAFELNDIS